MGKKLFPFFLLLLLGISGCASRDDVENLQRDMEEVKNRMYQSQKEISSIRVEAKQGADTTAKGVQTELENLRKTIADLQAAQDIMRVDVQSLTGRVDDVKQSGLKPSEDLALLKEDTDRRLRALEAKVADREAPAADTKPKENTPEALYQSGIDTFKNNETKKSRGIFSKFLELYPKHELASNARFWIGETYFNEKNLEQAILEYQEVIKNYPGKEKVPAALLKQAMAFQGLGDDKSARYIYKKLTEEYPKSEEAKKAKAKLKGIK